MLDRTHRSSLVRLIFAGYWLLIFEGALRKWVFPEYQRYLFFIRDPLVIATYLAAWRMGIWPVRSPFLAIGALFAAATVPLMVYQYTAQSSKFVYLIALYGWRNYFLYLPLPFIIAACVDKSDVETLLRRSLLLTVPLAVLVYFQFSSAPTATINQGYGDPENTFSGLAVTHGKIRPLGTFTSNQGQNPFVAGSVAMLLTAWMTPSIAHGMRWLALIAATCGTASMVALSGSRTAVLWSGLIVVAAIGTALLASARRSPVPMLLVPLILLLLAGTVLPLAYPEAIGAFEDRWQDASKFEVATHGGGGVFSRALNDFFLFRYLLTDEHLGGYQMGIGGNAAYLMGLRDSMMRLETYQEGIAIESEWGRHVADMGVLGVLFIAYRIAFVVWLFWAAARATMRSGDAHPMLLFSFAGLLLLNGQITGQGAQNGFAWIFTGFTLVVIRAADAANQRLPPAGMQESPEGRLALESAGW